MVALAVVPRDDFALQALLCGLIQRGKAREARLPRCKGREIFDLVLSILGGVAELLKGSTIYNAMQRALGAKVGPGVCWLGRQHVEMAHPILRTGHRGSF